jgi:hypothetical protein
MLNDNVRRTLVPAFLFMFAVLIAGCGGSGGGQNGGASGTGAGASGGAGGGPGGGVVTLPLVVDDHAGPGSCYGKAATVGAVDQTPNDAGCVAPAAGGAGKCWRIDYHPSGGTDAFGGCQWSLDPSATAALAIEPGATRAIFTAAGVAGGEMIQFFAGGTPADRDAFVAQKITLTAAMAPYEVPIPDLTAKTQVHVPFGYTIVDGDNTGASLSFYVTGIEWVK